MWWFPVDCCALCSCSSMLWATYLARVYSNWTNIRSCRENNSLRSKILSAPRFEEHNRSENPTMVVRQWGQATCLNVWRWHHGDENGVCHYLSGLALITRDVKHVQGNLPTSPQPWPTWHVAILGGRNLTWQRWAQIFLVSRLSPLQGIVSSLPVSGTFATLATAPSNDWHEMDANNIASKSIFSSL